jgi:cytochrome c556
MQRRQFLKASALGSVVSITGTASGAQEAAASKANPKVYRQPATDIPVVEEVDVVVCGGGPAGISAAIAAGRAGARVRLLEVHGFLGGVWTAGMVNNLIDHENKTGIMKDIESALEDMATQRHTKVFDVEAMKLVLERLCGQAQVQPLYHSRVVAAAKDKQNRVTHAVVENKSGRQAFAAKAFVDATGDGDFAAQAGCGFSWGHPVSGQTQPMSMIALLGGIQYADLNPLRFVRGDGVSGKQSKAVFLKELGRAGIEPSYRQPTLFPIRNDHFAMMANHEYGVSGIDAQQVTDASIRSREEIHAMVVALRKLGGVWKDLQLLATGAQIGVREGRRIHGRYTVTKEDLIKGARFDDAVCRSTFNVDIHALEPGHAGGGYTTAGTKVIPYDIPLRALIAKDADGLLMAGRCISGDFYSHASYRVTGNAVALGEAAGKTAALAALSGRLPHEIDVADLKKGS